MFNFISSLVMPLFLVVYGFRWNMDIVRFIDRVVINTIIETFGLIHLGDIMSVVSTLHNSAAFTGAFVLGVEIMALIMVKKSNREAA